MGFSETPFFFAFNLKKYAISFSYPKLRGPSVNLLANLLTAVGRMIPKALIHTHHSQKPKENEAKRWRAKDMPRGPRS